MGNTKSIGVAYSDQDLTGSILTDVVINGATVTGDILPEVDNTYSLGSPDKQWLSVHIGPGSIFLEDTTNPSLKVELTVTAGVLLINGANQLQVGQLKFINNQIQSITPGTDITIGYSTDTADVVINRDLTVAANASVQGTTQLLDGVFMPRLPTADPHVAGKLWNSLGTVKVSAG